MISIEFQRADGKRESNMATNIKKWPLLLILKPTFIGGPLLLPTNRSQTTVLTRSLYANVSHCCVLFVFPPTTIWRWGPWWLSLTRQMRGSVDSLRKSLTAGSYKLRKAKSQVKRLASMVAPGGLGLGLG